MDWVNDDTCLVIVQRLIQASDSPEVGNECSCFDLPAKDLPAKQSLSHLAGGAFTTQAKTCIKHTKLQPVSQLAPS